MLFVEIIGAETCLGRGFLLFHQAWRSFPGVLSRDVPQLFVSKILLAICKQHKDTPEGNGRMRAFGNERTSCMKRYILTGAPGSGKVGRMAA